MQFIERRPQSADPTAAARPRPLLFLLPALRPASAPAPAPAPYHYRHGEETSEEANSTALALLTDTGD